VTVIAREKDSVAIEDTDFWKEMQTNRVGNLLTTARLKVGLTQKQLAEKTGIKQNMVSEYGKGRGRITKTMASKFAVILRAKSTRLQAGIKLQ
jgi:ribosome-binding protein aMBF1 (putative translation factor)